MKPLELQSFKDKPTPKPTTAQESDRIVEFRPALLVRGIWMAVAAPAFVCITAGAPKLVTSGYRGFLLILLLSLPVWGAYVSARYKIRVSDQYLELYSAFRIRKFAWNQVRRVDQTRSSWVVSIGRNNIGLGWIDRRTRERLFRLILQHAGLVYQMTEMRWGIRARYLPKSVPISLTLPTKVDSGKRHSS